MFSPFLRFNHQWAHIMDEYARILFGMPALYEMALSLK